MPEPQDKMKKKLTGKRDSENGEEGDNGLLLSPNKGTLLGGKFQGPYSVACKIDYELWSKCTQKEEEDPGVPREEKNTQIVRANLS